MNKTILILAFLVGRYKFKINSIAKITKSTRLKYIFLDGQLAIRSSKSESQLVTQKTAGSSWPCVELTGNR